MAEFEDNPDAAKVFITAICYFGVNDCNTSGQRSFRLMVIEHDHIYSGLLKIGDQLTTDWSKKAGSDGEAVIANYKKM